MTYRMKKFPLDRHGGSVPQVEYTQESEIEMSVDSDLDMVPRPTTVENVDERELYSLDATLTEYILPRIRAFRAFSNTHPVYTDETLPLAEHATSLSGLATTAVSHSFPDDETADVQDAAYWENILYDIEEGFAAHHRLTIDDLNYDLSTKEIADTTAKMKKGLALFATHYAELWD